MMMVLTALIGGGMLAALFGVRRLGLLVSVLAILASFCLRPGYISTLMSADGVITAAQSTWVLPLRPFCWRWVLLRALLYARMKSGQAVLAMTALVVIAAELVGRIGFYNLWTIPM